MEKHDSGRGESMTQPKSWWAPLRIAAGAGAMRRYFHPLNSGSSAYATSETSFAVSGPAHQRVLDASAWTMGILIRPPAEAPHLLRRTSHVIAAKFEGRYPVTSLAADVIMIAARVEDASARSEQLARDAGRLAATVLGYHESTVELVTLMKDGNESCPRIVGGQLDAVYQAQLTAAAPAASRTPLRLV